MIPRLETDAIRDKKDKRPLLQAELRAEFFASVKVYESVL